MIRNADQTGAVAIVTGGSSGIGRFTADALAKRGMTVYECSRSGCDREGVRHITADVTDEAGIAAAVEEVHREAGRIDYLVCCAGFGISGAVEFTAAEDAKRQFEVNFFGAVNTVKAVLPYMRRAEQGSIAVISSVAAVAPIPFQSFYSASKAAINCYVSALANEVKPFHIRVCAIMPGDIATGFTAARKKTHQGDDLYGGRIERAVAKMEKDERTGMSAELAGELVARIVLSRKTPLATVGFAYQCVAVLCKVLPMRLVNFLIRMLYAR